MAKKSIKQTVQAAKAETKKALEAAEPVITNAVEELQAAAKKVVKNFCDNTWAIGFLNDSGTYYAANKRIHNFNEGFIQCDELRFLGYGKPYTWFIQE